MKKIKYLIFPILLLISFSVTYAIFSSSKSGSGNVSAANWLVKLETIDDEIDITGGRQNINFGSCEKFMPGNPCVLPLNIDATNTEVDTVVTLEIGEIVGATKEELDLAGVSFKISDGVNEGYSYNVGYRTKKNLNLVIDWELGNINDTNKTKADLNLSKIQNNITVPVSIIVRQALNTPRTVTFNTHVDRIASPSSIEVIEGLTISNIPVIQDNEYEFDGWYTKEKGGIKLTNNTIITDDIEYHAHYSNIRTITFNSYGGSNIDDIEVLSGNTISTLPTPTKFGYTFNGWYANIVGGEQLTSSTEITSDRTYYAHWVTKYYTLTFNSDGSSVSPIQVQEGESLSSSNISIPTSEKDGYTLSGWFNNSEELTTSKQILSDLTYIASWTANTYTITFDYNGATGNNSTASKTVTYDSTYGSLPEPTKTGYTFQGWNGKNLFNKNAIQTNTYGSGTISGERITVSGTYYCSFEMLLPAGTYTVSYDVISSTAIDGFRFEYEDHSFSDFLYSGYNVPTDKNIIALYLYSGFGNYGTTVYENVQVESGNIATPYEPYYLSSTAEVTQAKNHTLTAIWEPITYTVNFNSNGGTGTMLSQPMTYDTSNTLTSNTFTRSGYNFGGWNGIIYSNSAEIDSSNDLYPDNREFMQYADLAPYFNKYGTNQKYHMELDLKATSITGNNDWINIYFQNGNTSRYGFKTIDGVDSIEKNVILTSTDYVHVSFDFEVFLGNPQETYAMLAFYGDYGSGRYPMVKNVRVSLVPDLSDGQVVSNLTTNDSITLYARWKKLLYSSDQEIHGSNEFMQYAELASYIDTYGVNSVYNLEFDIKSDDVSISNIMYVYFQNGMGAKYSFGKNIEVTTEYRHVNFDFVPLIWDETTPYAMLAFYGEYGTGNIPWVKNVRFSVYQ